MGLLTGLKTFDITRVKPDMSKKAKKMIAALKHEIGTDGAELIAELKKRSIAATGLYKWAAATDKYYDIFRMVEPKKKECARLQEMSDTASAELAKTLASLQVVTEQLKSLNAAQKVKQDELDILLKRQAEMARKLSAASKLITGLGSERDRWTQ
jgi:dynein heavy chain